MKTMKELAADLIATRSALLNAQDDVRRAKEAYILAEDAYLDGMGERCRTTVFQGTAISLSDGYPDNGKGEYLEFDNVEVL